MRILNIFWCAALMLLCSLESCSESPIDIRLAGVKQTESVFFLEQELNALFYRDLSEYGQQNIRYSFVLKKDNSLNDGAFMVDVKRRGQNVEITLSGGDEIGISHALYTFLEDIGYRFEISGITRPVKFSLDQIRDKHQKITPVTRWRGIRQHMNFPMDISSYPIEEAKEYVRNLVRLRFNKLAVHSYPNLWHEVRRKDTTDYAGNFFYGLQHDIPDLEIFSDNIRYNHKIFCIPAIEPYYHDNAQRSMMAVAWMKELLTYAKSIGLKIQFSIEPRSAGDMTTILETCRSVIDSYPMIDELEIITEELGGWGDRCTESQTRAVLVEQFGKEVLNDTVVTAAIRSEQTDLDNLFYQMGRNIKAIKIMENDSLVKNKGIDLKIGIYCAIPEYARAAYRLARVFLPDNEVSVMPGHGSKRVAVNFPMVTVKKEDLRKTSIYSWIEFDGLMFTQQNAIEGIHDLMVWLKEKNGSDMNNQVLFNHWRTAENRTTSRYASLVSIFGPIDPARFYGGYIRDLGVPDSVNYIKAMLLLEKIDWISTNDLPNVGFCWTGAWRDGGPFLRMNRANLQKVKAMYGEVGDIVEGILQQTTKVEGKDFLSFLSNRVQASFIYLDAFEKATEIQMIKRDDTGNISEPEQRRAADICNQALLIFDKYMNLHSQMMPDRGCEGTLINMYYAPIYGLKVLRNKFGNIPIDAESIIENSKDAPPLPIYFK